MLGIPSTSPVNLCDNFFTPCPLLPRLALVCPSPLKNGRIFHTIRLPPQSQQSTRYRTQGSVIILLQRGFGVTFWWVTPTCGLCECRFTLGLSYRYRMNAMLANGEQRIEIAPLKISVSCLHPMQPLISDSTSIPCPSELPLSDIHVSRSTLLRRIYWRSVLLSHPPQEATLRYFASGAARRSPRWSSSTHAHDGLRSDISRMVQNIWCVLPVQVMSAHICFQAR